MGRTIIALLSLCLEVLTLAVQVALTLLGMAGQLMGWLLSSVVGPAVKEAAALISSLATKAADSERRGRNQRNSPRRVRGRF